jgi:hypothetical protein
MEKKISYYWVLKLYQFHYLLLICNGSSGFWCNALTIKNWIKSLSSSSHHITGYLPWPRAKPCLCGSLRNSFWHINLKLIKRSCKIVLKSCCVPRMVVVYNSMLECLSSRTKLWNHPNKLPLNRRAFSKPAHMTDEKSIHNCSQKIYKEMTIWRQAYIRIRYYTET